MIILSRRIWWDWGSRCSLCVLILVGSRRRGDFNIGLWRGGMGILGLRINFSIVVNIVVVILRHLNLTDILNFNLLTHNTVHKKTWHKVRKPRIIEHMMDTVVLYIRNFNIKIRSSWLQLNLIFINQHNEKHIEAKIPIFFKETRNRWYCQSNPR